MRNNSEILNRTNDREISIWWLESPSSGSDYYIYCYVRVSVDVGIIFYMAGA